jgi:hypothetical protein
MCSSPIPYRHINDNVWIYYVPSKNSITILRAGQDPIDIPVKEAGKLSVDSNCKRYSRAALLQSLRTGKVNTPDAKEHRLLEVQLHNEYCEELGNRVNLSNRNLN